MSIFQIKRQRLKKWCIITFTTSPRLYSRWVGELVFKKKHSERRFILCYTTTFSKDCGWGKKSVSFVDYCRKLFWHYICNALLKIMFFKVSYYNVFPVIGFLICSTNSINKINFPFSFMRWKSCGFSM